MLGGLLGAGPAIVRHCRRQDFVAVVRPAKLLTGYESSLAVSQEDRPDLRPEIGHLNVVRSRSKADGAKQPRSGTVADMLCVLHVGQLMNRRRGKILHAPARTCSRRVQKPEQGSALQPRKGQGSTASGPPCSFLLTSSTSIYNHNHRPQCRISMVSAYSSQPNEHVTKPLISSTTRRPSQVEPCERCLSSILLRATCLEESHT